MIVFTPNAPPELACDECGCRHFDRLNNCCYECATAISDAAVADYQAALERYLSAAGAERETPPDKGG